MAIWNFWKNSTVGKDEVVMKQSDVENIKSTTYATMFLDSMVDGGDVSTTYSSMSRSGYMSNGATYNAIRSIAQCAGAVPWALFTGTGEDKDRILASHPLTDLWARPNPLMGNSRFIENIVSYLQIAGECFIVTSDSEGNPGGTNARSIPEMLTFMRPDNVDYNNPTDPLSDLTWKINGRNIHIPRESVLHLKWFHPLDDNRGLSPIEVSRVSIEQSNLSRLWNKSLMKKAGRPSSILKSRVSPPKEVRDKILQRFRENIGGAANAGDVIFLTGDVEWEKAALTPEEMSWSEGQKMAGRDISVVQGTPPQLNGDTEASTYANYQEARKALYQETVLPILTFIRDEFNVWLTPRYSNSISLDILKSEIDALQEDRGQEWARISNADWLTINEKRKAVGLDPISDERAETPIILLPKDNNVNEDEEINLSERILSSTQFKAFNLQDETEVAIHWKQIEATRNSLIPDTRKKIGRAFKEEAKSLINELYETESTEKLIGEMDVLLAALFLSLENTLKSVYADVSVKFGRAILRKLPEQIVPQRNVLSIVEQEALSYLDEIVSDKIDLIHSTTSKRVVSAIHSAVEDGADLDGIAKAINKELSDKARLNTIAETETIAAANIGAQKAAANSGYELKKRWVTQLDSRVRDHHSFAHGQEKHIDEPFIVMGEKLEFPGDSRTASASNTINCRCVESYVIVQSIANNV